MYEATAGKVDPTKLIYPYDFETANDRLETPYFHTNRIANQECAHAIDRAISTSNYKTNHYNLELAVMSAALLHGFERINAVLAHQIQQHGYDGRYSEANKKWAESFLIPDKAFTFLNSHAILIDDFTVYARKLYGDMGADRFALPGCEEYGETVHGYQIVRSIMVNDRQGYAIAHNPDAVSPYVCWQFMLRDGKRHYNWGLYGDYNYAIDSYNARIYVALN